MITIDQELCKGCDICIEFCPRKVYEKSDTMNKKGIYPPLPTGEDECTRCDICVLMCPDQAIGMSEKHD